MSIIKHKFEIQELQEIIIEADNKEDARMKIIDRDVETMLNNSCDNLGLDPYVSDGEEVFGGEE